MLFSLSVLAKVHTNITSYGTFFLFAMTNVDFRVDLQDSNPTAGVGLEDTTEAPLEYHLGHCSYQHLSQQMHLLASETISLSPSN